MERRHFLGVSAAVMSGCVTFRENSDNQETASVASTESPGPIEVDDSPKIAESGTPPTICDGEINAGRFPAIVDPAFATDWVGIDIPDQWEIMLTADSEEIKATGLPDHEKIIGVSRDGVARAYPLVLLFWHEIVNDTIDRPYVVTFCPDCSSGLVAERSLMGQETIFGVTGQRWKPPDARGQEAIESDLVFPAAHVNDSTNLRASVNPNLVMFDTATRSYWSQLLAMAICGPLTGERLTVLPSAFTSWDDWRSDHPDGELLLPPPHSTTITSDRLGIRESTGLAKWTNPPSD